MWRTLAYLLMGIAGLLLQFSPILLQDLGIIGVIMAWFLLIGGVLCAWGAIKERWVGEFVGIPLLSSSFAVFGIISSIDTVQVAPFIAFANLSLLFAVSFGLLARWREVKAVYRLAVHLSETEDQR